MAQLVSTTVTFILPKGDDKDWDTSVQIIVRDGSNRVIAENDNVAPGQHFSDPGTYGPFGVGVVNANASVDDFMRGASQIIIHPNGHDRWITDVVVTLHWNDGSGRECQSHNIILDQNVNTASWTNSQARDKGRSGGHNSK